MEITSCKNGDSVLVRWTCELDKWQNCSWTIGRRGNFLRCVTDKIVYMIQLIKSQCTLCLNIEKYTTILTRNTLKSQQQLDWCVQHFKLVKMRWILQVFTWYGFGSLTELGTQTGKCYVHPLGDRLYLIVHSTCTEEMKCSGW